MKEFNIKQGTVKLGTLYEYKKTELKHIADKDEGYLKFKVRFDGVVELPTEWFNSLGGGLQLESTPGIKFPGKTNAHFESMNIIRSDNQNVLLKDSIATIERQAPNSFVFCMSHTKDVKDCIDIFPEYNDSWHLQKLHAEKFGAALGTLLRDAIVEGYKTGNHIVSEDISIDNFSIQMNSQLVDYTSREIHIKSNDFFSLNNFMQKMHNIVFIKPATPFKKELEYRFNYTITSKQRIIEPIVKSIILDSSHLQQFLI